MQPDEYFLTSIAGRRAIVESGQGNIAQSGYLERKMIKALESCVVNQRRQVVNLRTEECFHHRLETMVWHLITFAGRCKHKRRRGTR